MIILKIIKYIFLFEGVSSQENIIQFISEKLQEYFEYKFAKAIIDHLEHDFKKLFDLNSEKIKVLINQKYDLKELSLNQIIRKLFYIVLS